MSTRACVAYKTPAGWKGTYSHFDGYAPGLGNDIWTILRRDFIGNRGPVGVENDGDVATAIHSFIEVYIKGHRGGWSLFGKVCHRHDPAFVMRDGVPAGWCSSRLAGAVPQRMRSGRAGQLSTSQLLSGPPTVVHLSSAAGPPTGPSPRGEDPARDEKPDPS